MLVSDSYCAYMCAGCVNCDYCMIDFMTDFKFDNNSDFAFLMSQSVSSIDNYGSES